eukprot:28408_1
MSALKIIDSMISMIDEDEPSTNEQKIDPTEVATDEINLDHPLFINKNLRILFCGMGYPYVPNRVKYLQSLGYSNITLLPQCNLPKDAEQVLHKHIIEEKNTNYDAILNCWLCVSSSIQNQVLPNCKVISCVSSGFKYADYVYCKKNDVYLTNCPLALNKTAADMAVGLMIATCRQFYHSTNVLRQQGVQGFKLKTLYQSCGEIDNVGNPLTKDLNGSTVGIVGLGTIGKEISKRLAFGFDCKCYYFNGKNKKRKAYDTAVGAVHCASFDELIQMSDFVVAVCPLNDETKHMFNANVFRKMKKDAIFINIGRGGLCNTNDLINALKNGDILAAGLDVTDPEPLPTDHELWTLKNVTILNHIGSSTVKTRQRMMNTAIDNILRVVNGVPCENVVCAPR